MHRRTNTLQGPEGWSSQPQKNWFPKSGEPKISRFVFPLPPPFRSFGVSLGVFSCNFGGVLKRRGPQMCTFGVLGLSSEAPAAPKPPGIHTAREPKRTYFRVSAPQTPSKFNEKTPRETEKERNGGGRGKKRAKFLAVRRREVVQGSPNQQQPQQP